MSKPSTLRALPTIIRVAWLDALAYRAEMLVWVLSTTMPFVMLSLFSTVSSERAMGRFGQREFVAYFMSAFIVRQLTMCWAAWQINVEVRHGTLATRLLRPVHPILSYAIENAAALPMRLVAIAPALALGVAYGGLADVPRGAAGWAALLLSLAGSWLITFCMHVLFGCMSLFFDSSLKMLDLWMLCFFVLSGYTIPIELFPPGARAVADALPFRYQLGLSVDILSGAPADGVAAALAVQWGYVVALVALVSFVWSRGRERFASFGG